MVGPLPVFEVPGDGETRLTKRYAETAWTTSNWMPVDVVYELVKNE